MTSTICALPGCKSPVSRSNQTYCCKAHRQLAYVREKRRQAPGMDTDAGKASTSAVAPARSTAELREMASEAGPPTPARPCTRPGYPEGIFEAKDGNGLPLFIDADGHRLLRVWGPSLLSDFQLRHMSLSPTKHGWVVERPGATAAFQFYRSNG